jgi:hypothetical protein
MREKRSYCDPADGVHRAALSALRPAAEVEIGLSAAHGEAGRDPSALLCPVHEGVGFLDQVIGKEVGPGMRDAPNGECDRRRAPAEAGVEIGPDLGDGGLGGGLVRLRQEDGELIAPEAGHDIRCAQLLPDGEDHAAEKLVTGGLP